MKKILTATIALTLCATMSHATWGKTQYGGDGGDASSYSDADARAASHAAAIAAQEQAQRQQQAQSQRTNVDASSSNRNTQRATQQTATTVEIQGDRIEGSVALAALGSGGCSGGGITAGADGAGLGVQWSSDYCKNLAMAAAAELYGGSGAAYLCATDRKFRLTQPALCSPRAVISNQAYDAGKIGTAVSTRTAPVTLYTSCEVIGNRPHITVPHGMASDASYVQRAAEACYATR